LLVWDKDSCTGNFLVIVSCIYIFLTQFVHLL
jgi:hypothetical protein